MIVVLNRLFLASARNGNFSKQIVESVADLGAHRTCVPPVKISSFLCSFGGENGQIVV